MISPSRTTPRPTQYPRFDDYPNRPCTTETSHHVSLEQVPDGSIERLLDVSAKFTVGGSTVPQSSHRCPYQLNSPLQWLKELNMRSVPRAGRINIATPGTSPACLAQSPVTVAILRISTSSVERLDPSLGCMSVILKANHRSPALHSYRTDTHHVLSFQYVDCWVIVSDKCCSSSRICGIEHRTSSSRRRHHVFLRLTNGVRCPGEDPRRTSPSHLPPCQVCSEQTFY